MTREESRDAILAEWNRLPAWRRRSTGDAAEFAQIMLTSRPDISSFDCPFDRFLIVRSWLVAEQRAVESAGSKKRGARTKAAAATAQVKPA